MGDPGNSNVDADDGLFPRGTAADAVNEAPNSAFPEDLHGRVGMSMVDPVDAEPAPRGKLPVGLGRAVKVGPKPLAKVGPRPLGDRLAAGDASRQPSAPTKLLGRAGDELSLRFDGEDGRSLEDVIALPELLTAVRSGDPRVQEAFRTEDSMRRVFDLLANADKRLAARVFGLFQPAKSALLRWLAESIVVAEYAMRKARECRFAMGCVFRAFERAFLMWPHDMSDIFRLSDVLWPATLEMLDELSVVQFISTLATERQGYLWIFMWGVFRMLNHDADYRLTTKYVPRLARWPINHDGFNAVHFANGCYLLALFLRQHPEEAEFAELVTQWAAVSAWTRDVGVVVASLGPDRRLVERALGVLRMEKPADAAAVYWAMRALLRNGSAMEESEVVEVADRVLQDRGLPDVTRAMGIVVLGERHCAAVWQAVRRAWTRREPWVVPGVLALAARLPTADDGVERFVECVVKPWVEDSDLVDMDFVF